MLYSTYFFLFLLLPGLLLSKNITGLEYRLLSSFSYSVVLFISILLIMDITNIHTDYLIKALIGTIVLSAGFYFFKQYRQSAAWPPINHTHQINKTTFYYILAIASAFIFYVAAVGIYNDIPSDIYFRLWFANTALNNFDLGLIGDPVAKKHLSFNINGDLWYYMIASISSISGYQIIDILDSIIIVNSIVFLLAVFLFSKIIYRNRKSKVNTNLVSILAVLFVFSHLGTNIFSFIRYYAFAPTITNFILYFYAISLVVRLIESGRVCLSEAGIFILLLITMYVIHAQEMLFTVSITISMIFYQLVRILIGSTVLSSVTRPTKYGFSFLSVTTISVIMLSIITIFFLILFSPTIDHLKVIELSAIFPFGNNLFILNPLYQFYETITPWGILVYVLFIFHWGHFKDNPYIVAGMFLPVITVFNPIFVDIFLQFSTKITLWRLCYVIPIHFVAAYLVIYYITCFKRYKVHQNISSVIVMVCLAGLLTPLKIYDWRPPFSKYYSLKAIPSDNTPEYWKDMLDFLNSIPEDKNILTDPVSGYIISGLTNHYSPRYKFFNKNNIKLNFNEYNEHPLSDYAGWLIVTNQRDGGKSVTGRFSGHWPEDILKIKQYYNPSLMAELSNRPDRYEKIWGQNHVTIYKIK